MNKNNYLIIAPPRSGSTVIEKVLSGSCSIQEDLHEPFMEFGRRNGDREEANKTLQNIANNTKPTLIKEMTHDIMRDNIYKDLVKTTDNPIVIVIRHPFLCVESRLKAILNASSVSLRDSTKKFIAGEKLDKEKSNQELLDEYAQKKGYENWSKYTEKFINQRNYGEFEDFFMSDTERFMTGFGWGDLDIVIEFFDKMKKPYIVINGTDFRNSPAKSTEKLCESLGIKYGEEMLKWKKGSYSHIGKIWYKEINNSENVQGDTVETPSISCFPEPVQKYLNKIAMPYYKRLILKMVNGSE